MAHFVKLVTPKKSKELMENAVANQDPSRQPSGSLEYPEDVQVRVPDQRLIRELMVTAKHID